MNVYVSNILFAALSFPLIAFFITLPYADLGLNRPKSDSLHQCARPAPAATLSRALEENNMMTARADRLPAMRRAAL